MKTKPVLAPDAAFPDEKRQPAETDLPGALGLAYVTLQEIIRPFAAAHPDVAPEWKYSPRSGWHQIYSRKKRRLFYLIPAHGDFRLSLILGDKAIEALQAGPCARQMSVLLQTAKRYPEGTAFSFNRKTLDAGLAEALLEAKIAH